MRDAFLLARELCLHYADYHELQPSHFTQDKHGRLLLEKYRVKQASGRRIKIVALVSARAERIWNQYNQQIPSSAGNVYLRKVVAQLGQMAGLERPLTFSHARDSGIFRVVASGCPEVQIKLAAGWTSTKVLTKYVTFDRRLLEALNSPASPNPEPTNPTGSDKDSLVPDRQNPFLHIYKAC